MKLRVFVGSIEPMRWVLLLIAIHLITACSGLGKTPEPASPPPAEEQATASTPPAQPEVVRDPLLEQQLARSELRLLEKEAQVENLQVLLDDARQEVVRTLAKLQSSATRAEAASGIAEAEIALQSLRTTGTAPVAQEVSQLLKLATAEFDKQNYGGALYLASQAKGAAVAARGQFATAERAALRPGEAPFALPLQLQTTGRANVREGPGSGFKVLFTLPASASLTGYSFAEQWVRVTDESGRRGWIYQGLIGRQP
jgi:hypothetical protein